MRSLICFSAIAFCLSSCSPVIKKELTKKMIGFENQLQDHTGFILVDLAEDKTLFEYKSDKYFTPASNTKIFTFFASLKILGDSVPAFHYHDTKDSLILWGTGDPSFLYKNVFDNGRVYSFLKNTRKPIYLSYSNYYTSAFGMGWAWDDYNGAYSSERSPFPVYGNIFTVRLKKNAQAVTPPYFQKHFSLGEEKEKTEVVREVHSNQFKFHWGKRKSSTTEWNIPIKIDQRLVTQLLTDTLVKSITPINKTRPDSTIVLKTFYSIPSDSLYSIMMQDSDNFIAEQLLLMCSDVLSDTLQPEIAIKYVKDNLLKDLPDEPIWVDGSGLSRYNLFTPRSIVNVWQKIYGIVPQDRLFALLATGGVNGTVKNWYKGDKPYFFGKTGTVSNVHCLSGFLVAKSGKVLVFSFMNNNYVQSTNKVRLNMQETLKMIYERY